MTIHKVKSWPYLFQAVLDDKKFHDIRNKDERNYRVGDTLILEEFDQTTGRYTGRAQAVEITYITSNDTPCALSSAVLDKGACILSIRKV